MSNITVEKLVETYNWSKKFEAEIRHVYFKLILVLFVFYYPEYGIYILIPWIVSHVIDLFFIHTLLTKSIGVENRINLLYVAIRSLPRSFSISTLAYFLNLAFAYLVMMSSDIDFVWTLMFALLSLFLYKKTVDFNIYIKKAIEGE